MPQQLEFRRADGLGLPLPETRKGPASRPAGSRPARAGRAAALRVLLPLAVLGLAACGGSDWTRDNVEDRVNWCWSTDAAGCERFGHGSEKRPLVCKERYWPGGVVCY